MKDFNNKVAAITGAGSGMGRTLAQQLAARGCHLALSDINEKGLAETVALVADAGVKVTSQKLDVAVKKDVHAWADKVVKDHGKVNLIFNNAGVALGSLVDGGSYEDFEWIMNINFWGVVYGTKAFLPYLKDSGDGHIINTSSLFGIMAVPSQSAYNASKFAVRGFTEALRQELELQNVGVSATSVHPGGIKTNIAKSARMDKSVNAIGMNEKSQAQFEKLFTTTAEDAAKVILKAVENNDRRCLIGNDAKALDLMVRLVPSAYQKLVSMGSKRMK